MDSRVIGLTSSLLVAIKCTRGIRVFKRQTCHFTNHSSVPPRLATVCDGGVSKKQHHPLGLPVPVTGVIVTGVSCEKVITDVQTSEGKLCDLGKQNDSLPFSLISQSKFTEVMAQTDDNKPAEAT